MRPFYLLISLIFCLFLIACGKEDVLTPPVFSEVVATGSLNSPTILTLPSQDLAVTISGKIDDIAAKIVANSTVTGEKVVAVNPDGSWSFPITPLEGANTISFTASDLSGNINQMYLTVTHDVTAPTVLSVTQSVDPAAPKLFVSFNEALLPGSMTTAIFAVENADGTPLTGPLPATLTLSIVTLTLNAPLATGPYKLTCSGVTDLSTPLGNSASTIIFDFTIIE